MDQIILDQFRTGQLNRKGELLFKLLRIGISFEYQLEQSSDYMHTVYAYII